MVKNHGNNSTALRQQIIAHLWTSDLIELRSFRFNSDLIVCARVDNTEKKPNISHKSE